jgi:hypothetical protein
MFKSGGRYIRSKKNLLVSLVAIQMLTSKEADVFPIEKNGFI